MSGQAAAQSDPRAADPKKAELEPRVNETRWRALLDGLNDEARTLQPEQRRPYAQAEVADAYWNLEKARSEELFTAALETALTLKPGSRQTSKAIRYVLSVAAKRDVNLGRRLSEKLAQERAKNQLSSSEPVGAATDLLTSDAGTAARLAEAAAPAGLSSDAAGVFILELAQKDLNASQSVYRAYLSKAAANPRIPLNQLLWLGGYPFGYGETYGFPDRDLTRLIGMGGRRIPTLAPNAELASGFLIVAFQNIQNTLKEAELAPPERREALYSVCLFASLYLLPEVERYSPNLREPWWLLRQQAFAGVSEAQRNIVDASLQMVSSNRSAANNREEPSPASLTEKTESDLRDVEKMADGCARDRQYATITLQIHSRKDDQRALRVADHINNPSLHDSVLQFLEYDISLSAAEAGDFQQAQQHARRVTTPEQRGLLFVKVGDLAFRQKDPIRAAELLQEASRTTDSISDPAAKAGVLLATAAAFARFDLAQAVAALREAIKAVNHAKDPNVDGFRVLRRIELSCPDKPGDVWYGSSERAEQFSLEGTLALVSSSDPEGTLAMGRNIEDSSVRIRALTSIVGSLVPAKQKKVNR
jgi:hypothetical protein